MNQTNCYLFITHCLQFMYLSEILLTNVKAENVEHQSNKCNVKSATPIRYDDSKDTIREKFPSSNAYELEYLKFLSRK